MSEEEAIVTDPRSQTPQTRRDIGRRLQARREQVNVILVEQVEALDPAQLEGLYGTIHELSETAREQRSVKHALVFALAWVGFADVIEQLDQKGGGDGQ